MLCAAKLSLENESEIKQGRAFRLKDRSEIAARGLLSIAEGRSSYANDECRGKGGP